MGYKPPRPQVKRGAKKESITSLSFCRSRPKSKRIVLQYLLSQKQPVATCQRLLRSIFYPCSVRRKSYQQNQPVKW